MVRSCLMLVILLCVCAVARADIISRNADGFFRDATLIEVVRVERVRGSQLELTPVRVLRGQGKTSRPMHHMFPSPHRGDRLLRACGKSMCVLGRDRGDHYLLRPTLSTPAELRPGLVEKRALPLMARGRPAPDICLRARVVFVDEPTQTERLRITVRAGDGAGKQGVLHVNEGRTLLTLGKEVGEVLLTGPPPGPARDGCHDVRLRPTRPPARTRRAFQRARAGKLASLVLARGKLRIEKGHGWPRPGSYPLVVRYTRERGRRFECRLFGDRAPYQTYSKLSGRMLSFPAASKQGLYISLVGGFPRGNDLLDFSAAVRPGTRVSWPVRVHGANDAGRVVGRVTVRHVPDPR